VLDTGILCFAASRKHCPEASDESRESGKFILMMRWQMDSHFPVSLRRASGSATNCCFTTPSGNPVLGLELAVDRCPELHRYIGTYAWVL
jgi:hypothetical protein